MELYRILKDLLYSKHKHFLFVEYNYYKRYALIIKLALLFNKNYNSVKIYRDYKYHGNVVVVGLRYYGRNVRRRTNGYAKDWVRSNPNSKCLYCGVNLTRKNATVDHIIPVSKGGINSKVNFVICCEDCNRERGDDNFYSYLKKKSGSKYGFIKNKFLK